MASPDGVDSDLQNAVCNIINCVAIYYEKVTIGKAFLQKEKFKESEDFRSFERNFQS